MENVLLKLATLNCKGFVVEGVIYRVIELVETVTWEYYESIGLGEAYAQQGRRHWKIMRDEKENACDGRSPL